jgi:hypothetical protein
MSTTAKRNELYLAALPVIHLSESFGQTEEVLTLFPDKNFATEFSPESVDSFIATFKKRAKYLIGGNVVGYECFREPTETGNVIVRVAQDVR